MRRLSLELVHAGEFSHSIGMNFVDIPAGGFKMGSCKTVAGLKGNKNAVLVQAALTTGCSGNDVEASVNEVPQHNVNVSSFQIARAEVTLGQFKRYIIAADRGD